MKSWAVHYKNKYPGGSVESHEDSLNVYDVDGKHIIALRKDGGGSWHDVSAEQGLEGRHDLAPIPRDARIHKIGKAKSGVTRDGADAFVDGIVRDDQADQREELVSEFVCDDTGKVFSCDELSKKGYQFDDKHRVAQRPAKQVTASKKSDKDAAPKA